MIDKLKALTELFGPSGNERLVREYIITQIKDYVDEYKTDNMGNLIALVKAEGVSKGRFALVAHMDEIGCIVTCIEENGMLRISSLGWVSPAYSGFNRVVFENGAVGVMAIEEKNTEKELTLKNCFIDIGAENRAEAEKLVSIGDSCVFVRETLEFNGKYSGKAMDNRVGCLVLTELIKSADKFPYDVSFIFTAQEELGRRGAYTAAFVADADFVISVDVTDTGDVPGCLRSAIKSGGGAAVKIMDKGIVSDKRITDALIKCARENDIKYQLEIMTDGSTDAGVFQTAKGGCAAGGISIPCRYAHSPVEVVDKDDIKSVLDLLTKTVTGTYLC